MFRVLLQAGGQLQNLIGVETGCWRDFRQEVSVPVLSKISVR
ncbi:MAG TPA: hypothetical protein VK776_18315 [Bryobacteraceae bacterium]|nr:hypothetical protein [Bryobacteraceae bacterium]